MENYIKQFHQNIGDPKNFTFNHKAQKWLNYLGEELIPRDDKHKKELQEIVEILNKANNLSIY